MFLSMNRCSWCIIFMIIYILIARISRQTNFTPLNCEIKFLEEKLVYSTCIQSENTQTANTNIGFIIPLLTERDICCRDNCFRKVTLILFWIHTTLAYIIVFYCKFETFCISSPEYVYLGFFDFLINVSYTVSNQEFYFCLCDNTTK